jgi:REP element-mobilizing transposase RayT
MFLLALTFLSKYVLQLCKIKNQLLIKTQEYCKRVMLEISKVSNFTINTMEGDKNHVHLPLDIEPKISIRILC